MLRIAEEKKRKESFFYFWDVSFVNPEAKGLEGVLGGGGAGGLQQVHLIKRGRWNGTSPDSILACQEDGPDQHRL